MIRRISKRVGFTVQVHPDHNEYVRVENGLEIDVECNLADLHKHERVLSLQIMLLNIDDALRSLADMLMLQANPIFRTNITNYLNTLAERYTAEYDAALEATQVA